MKKYEGFLLCTDFDGTFSLPDARLSEENLKAVRHFQQNGGLFTVATGRTAAFVQEKRDFFQPNAPVIAMNGTLICDENNYAPLHEYPLDVGILPVLDALCETGLPEHIHMLSSCGSHSVWHRAEHAMRPSEFFENLPGVWYKAIIVQSAAGTLELSDYFGAHYADRFNANRSWAEGLEIHSLESGKGACLEWIRRRLGKSIHTTVGVGDYENDISLLKSADIGYAVGNALPSVKAAADRVTVPHTEHAIARIIEELLR